MHIRLVADVSHVAPSPAMTGYCMPFPVPGHTVQAQTNMAATLNIDWLADLVTQAAALGGRTRSRRDATCCARLDDGGGGGAAGRGALPSVHLRRPASAGRSPTPSPARR